MKKILALLLAVLMLVSCASCSGDKDESPSNTNAANATATDEDNGKIIEIKESNYVSYINEIYTNMSDYDGETVKIEGMYKVITAKNGNQYDFVYRVGPGCCGSDGLICGFEFTWDKTDELNEDDWIEVVGKLRTYSEIYNAKKETYITIDAISVTVKTERGAEKVSS